MSSVISTQALTKSHGHRLLFSDLAISVSEGERVALVGANGSGKSTLFRILVGLDHPDQGEVILRSGTHIGYVPQHDELPEHLTVGEAIAEVLPRHVESTDAAVAQALGQAGFSDGTTRVGELSGGWRKRLSIARALVLQPDLLLLDEPTNHLDIDGILWLQELLISLRAAVLFVSHDRYFLEDVAERVIELDRRYVKGFLSVPGHFSDFLEVRTETFAQMEQYQASLANKVRREVAWLRRGAKARTTKAKGRIKQAEALIEELRGLRTDERNAELEFSETGRRSKDLIRAEEVVGTRGARTIFSGLNLLLSPGRRVGIAGPNGCGKSTILEVLSGALEPSSGVLWRATGIRVAYFDQHREQLDPEQSLLRTLCPEGDSVVFNGRQLHVTGWARRFLFSSSQLQLPVGKLSGGEKARLLIARLMLQPSDLLILDEPTNDLDLPTLEVLEDALTEFAGAVVLVTHDRSLLDSVCQTVLGIMEDGRVHSFASYEQLQWARENRQEEEKKSKPKGEAPARAKPQTAKKLTFAEERDLETIEERIHLAETEVQEIQAEIATPEVAIDAGRLSDLCHRLEEGQRAVNQLYERWQALESKREEIQRAAQEKGGR